MARLLRAGDRFAQPVPGTVIRVLWRDGEVDGYEVRLDGAQPGETWLVPLASADVIVVTAGTGGGDARPLRE